jgi:DNA-binding NarL/FixJ family response regulator
LKDQTCLIVDDDRTFTEKVVRLLMQSGSIATCVRSSFEARQAVSAKTYALMLVELDLPDGDGVSLVERARCLDDPPAILLTAKRPVALASPAVHELRLPIVPKVHLSTNVLPWVTAALTLRSVRLPQGAPIRLDAMRSSVSPDVGLRRLTAREAQVLTLLMRGTAPKDIAHDLGLSHATVRTYARDAYHKMGASNLREVFALLNDRA